MAWYAQITDIKTTENDNYRISFSVYSDANPDLRIVRTLEFPMTTPRADMISAIVDSGRAVKNSAMIANSGVIGTILTIT